MSFSVKFGLQGSRELEELLNKMRMDFGEKDAQNILVSAVRKSMKPVLEQAKALAPIDTGQLRASLVINARRPTRRDMSSKYVRATDSAIALVTTVPIKRLERGLRVYDVEGSYKAKKDKTKKIIGNSDARAVAMEFGTKDVAARPYLRPALESRGQEVVNSLGDSLKESLEQYKVRQARKVIYGK